METVNVVLALVVGIITILGFVSGFFRWAHDKVKNVLRVLRGHPTIPSRTLAVVRQPWPRAFVWSAGTVGDEDATFLRGELLVTNITDRMVVVPSVKLRKPRTLGMAGLSRPLSDVSGTHALPPDTPTELDFFLIARPPMRLKGRRIMADVAVIDNFGNHHWIKGLCFEPVPEKKQEDDETA